MDAQTSADAYDRRRKEATGACTSAFLDSLNSSWDKYSKDAWALLGAMRQRLARQRHSQIPQLSTSHRINGKVSLFPIAKKA
jgi:hypothetical protein